MTLETYRRPRMIVLNPQSSAYEAARAMVDNHVGALLVLDRQTRLGIVTDRDLVSEVIAAGLDPRETPLRDVMTEEAVAVDIAADLPGVVALMKEHRCRRLPVLENGQPVGIVTLDDLLLEGAIGVDDAAAIVRAQLEEPTPYKPAGAVHPQRPARPAALPRGARALTRRNARATASYTRLLEEVEARTGLDRGGAERALRIVLVTLCRRVTPNEARDFIAQLPSRIQHELLDHLDGPDKRITRDSLDRELGANLGVDAALADQIAERVSSALSECVSAGEIEQLQGQLPAEMKSLFPLWNPSPRAA